MNETENQTLCPVCKTEVRNEPNGRMHCDMCGMAIGNSSVTLKRSNRKIRFCSEECKTKFLKLGFKSFSFFRVMGE